MRLLYGTWAYRLGNWTPGSGLKIGEELSPRRSEDDRHARCAGRKRRDASRKSKGECSSAEQASAEGYLNLMMFYEAAGGYGFASCRIVIRRIAI